MKTLYVQTVVLALKHQLIWWHINSHYSIFLQILDGSRVHPETYEWARKMAVDALEVR